jgi:hypothetical protein
MAFYASTPSYRIVLDTHGWDFGDELNRMSRRGEWDAMAEVIPDEVVAEVGVVAEPDRSAGDQGPLRGPDRSDRLLHPGRLAQADRRRDWRRWSLPPADDHTGASGTSNPANGSRWPTSLNAVSFGPGSITVSDVFWTAPS